VSERKREGVRYRDVTVKTAVTLIKLTLGLGIVYWLIDSGRLDLAMYRQTVDRQSLWLILGALGAQTASLLIILARWWFLVRIQGIPISLGTSLRISMQGMFAGLLIPGVLGLDGMRILHVRRNYRNQTLPGVASMVLDRALGLLGLLILAVLSGLVFAAWQTSQQTIELLLWMAFGLAMLGFVLAVGCGFVPVRKLRFLGRIRFFSEFVDALRSYRSHHLALATVILMSIVGHFLMVVASCFALAALGLEFTVLAVAIVTPILIVIRFIPLTPLGLGVTDYAAEELYSMVELAGGAEVQMLLRGTWILVLLLSGLAFFGRMRK